MREEQGPLQDLTHASATADCISRLSRSISNRHTSGLKPVVTYSKQSSATLSNRHKFEGTLCASTQLPSRIEGAILLTPLCHLLYICRVLEETSGPRAASNRRSRKRRGSVGAGFAHGFEDSSITSVQMHFLRNRAGVSRHGRFLLGKWSLCTARP